MTSGSHADIQALLQHRNLNQASSKLIGMNASPIGNIEHSMVAASEHSVGLNKALLRQQSSEMVLMPSLDMHIRNNEYQKHAVGATGARRAHERRVAA